MIQSGRYWVTVILLEPKCRISEAYWCFFNQSHKVLDLEYALELKRRPKTFFLVSFSGYNGHLSQSMLCTAMYMSREMIHANLVDVKPSLCL